MYLAEHFKVNGSYEILINEEIEKNFEKPQTSGGANKCYTSKIISAKIQSRHINRIKYDIFIKYNARNI